ncbi:MAG: pre-16S rRNA-processing nuclease YqgF [Bacillota bacterium]|jgi:RNase H-fold protein (predicted Holliday junction resolvase)|nr:pre-16S rRNA-processing nuclease YqgF [Bacillota bacterium]HOB91319.1 pre-16S rRNA-processing nuclease YqgF [Bacillota bacterium]HPZ53724.1 pre-16S rRNA-processing nuclease YqgF [Bacillota bacterium]HQD17915.1 pre-16S rRNA-processing nuclease YqgF [Bacillota bacterium]
MCESNETLIVAVDPGREKCGLAVLTLSGQVLEKAVVAPDLVPKAIIEALQGRDAEALVVGDRTAKQDLINILGESLIRRFRKGIVEVDEHLSSLEGRKRYLDDHPPKGLWRLIPRGLRVPAEPFDDYAAVVLAERYLRSRRS